MAPGSDPDVAALRAFLGRPLRVLHVGNIANNAYNNARIQRQAGIEADVISYDYYHVMSTPEWEDAAFMGEVDSDQPNWWATSLKGWSRPRWFVQGPVASCLQYLRARHLGLAATERLLWCHLEASCLGQVRYRDRLAGRPSRQMPFRLVLALEAATALGVDKGPSRRLSDAAIAELLAMKSADGSALFTIDAADPDNVDLLPPASPSLLPGSERRAVSTTKRGLGRLRQAAAGMFGRTGVRRAIGTAGQLVHRAARDEARTLSAYHAVLSQIDRDRHFVALVRSLRGQLEAIPPEQRAKFLRFYATTGAEFLDVFKFYDIVQGYSIDGGICLVNGFQPFVCYEHGTLRDLPFGDDFYGVVTRMTYTASQRVFVTNSDVLPSVEKMGLDPSRVVYLPHAFDDRKLMRFRVENSELAPAAGPPVIFSPTRQHWQDKSGSWTKGNDVLLRAAGIVAAEGLDFRLHLVEWGKEVPASKALIAELGIADKVVWLPTMQKRQLWEAYCSSHAVADQFVLPALGGVGFETMALGRRLLTAIDRDQLTRFFGASPPCLAAGTVEECAAQLRRIIADPADSEGLGEAAARWMSTYHSAERIVSLQAAAYRGLVDRGPAGEQRVAAA